jgi:hypothetical protein
MIALAQQNATALAAGHSFILFLGEGFFPIHVLNTLKRSVGNLTLSGFNFSRPPPTTVAPLEACILPAHTSHSMAWL